MRQCGTQEASGMEERCVDKESAHFMTTAIAARLCMICNPLNQCKLVFPLLTYDQRRTGKRVCRGGGDGGGSEATTNSVFELRKFENKMKTIHVMRLCN